MRKKIGIIFLLFLMTGCSLSYKLEVTENSITETGVTLFTQDELNGKSTREHLRELVSKYFINDDILIGQNTDYVKSNNEKGYRVINEYSNNNIDEIPTLFYCYDNVDIINTDKKISMKTTSSFLCYNYYDELGDVTIQISSKLKNISNNADEVKDGSYYWYINSENASNKQIYFEFQKKSNTNNFMILFSIIFAIVLITAIILIRKNKRTNQI